MTLRADSYGSVAEVAALTAYLLEGHGSFTDDTQPTFTQVEKFIDRASGCLNVALNNAGLTTPVTNSTAKLPLDDWVVARTVQFIEMTQRGAGGSDAEGSRTAMFRSMQKDAQDFIQASILGFKRLGVGVSHEMSEGLAFTGQTAQDDRVDPDDSTIEQPFFKRRMFDGE